VELDPLPVAVAVAGGSFWCGRWVKRGLGLVGFFEVAQRVYIIWEQFPGGASYPCFFFQRFAFSELVAPG
jgi:hypothetical protein